MRITDINNSWARITAFSTDRELGLHGTLFIGMINIFPTEQNKDTTLEPVVSLLLSFRAGEGRCKI